ncbi:MAG: ferritin family protein [Candidatus Nitrohelix vancouverensis]|uniref:Ferritin family protein n=1 Tax=Candidatus Nitrohelix vancouverensis TaxID=2705534 RepID=A0A7T0C1Q2_9BACT|nr:MAG: ferritin family protein [Candidatus Nitrohelix vancouverensis]
MTDTDILPTLSFQCADAIEVSILIERQGIRFYEKASKVAKEPRVRSVFAQLAQEEKDHMQALQAKSGFLQPALPGKSMGKRAVEPSLAELIKTEIFPDEPKREADPAQLKTDEEAIEMGIQSEMRSIAILEKLLERERKMDVRAVFAHLLAEEQRHLILLRNMKEQLGEGSASA